MLKVGQDPNPQNYTVPGGGVFVKLIDANPTEGPVNAIYNIQDEFHRTGITPLPLVTMGSVPRSTATRAIVLSSNLETSNALIGIGFEKLKEVKINQLSPMMRGQVR
jgi:hypothetical protein